MVKLVSSYVILLKVTETINSVKSLLYIYFFFTFECDCFFSIQLKRLIQVLYQVGYFGIQVYFPHMIGSKETK